MAKKNTAGKDAIKEVKFKVDKKAFRGPFKCCGRLTKIAGKKVSYRGMEFQYSTWKCAKCGKEYLDAGQANDLEKIWAVEMFLDGRSVSIERSLNYDGKTYFVRFPRDLTGGWESKKRVQITMLTPEKYFVEVV